MLKPEFLKPLNKEYNRLAGSSIQQLFKKDPARAQQFTLKAENIFFDYSKQVLDKKTLIELFNLTAKVNLTEKINQMFAGEKINLTEDRAVLHTALRDFSKESHTSKLKDITKLVNDNYKKMTQFAKNVLSAKFFGSTGQAINHFINIGIGGSELGPKMAARSLQKFSQPGYKLDFVSNLDPAQIEEILTKVDPEKVLFIVASKTFTTEETMNNAYIAKKWLKEKLGKESEINKHFIAVTTNSSKAIEFGIASEHIFTFSDWVGGRFSLASSIGISVMLLIGVENFDSLLAGMCNIDKHFQTKEVQENIPIILGLLGFWNNNFLKLNSQAILPYSADLSLFPAYLQQLEMESNGKSIDQQGKIVNYKTCPIIWGAAGTDGQHSFYQLLHQGTQIVSADFIGFKKTTTKYKDSHQKLMSHFFAQQQALAFGCDDLSILDDGNLTEFVKPYKTFLGNRPNSCLLFDELNPFALGQLVAIYEHKVFVQGILWNIFSFDQWGVELGKVLAKKIQKIFENPEQLSDLDSSTANAVKEYLLR